MGRPNFSNNACPDTPANPENRFRGFTGVVAGAFSGKKTVPVRRWLDLIPGGVGGDETPPGASSPLAIQPKAAADPIQEEKPERIPPDARVRILETLDAFRQEHGDALTALGWNRQNMFSGLNPATATTYENMPALPLLLADGGRLVKVTRNFLAVETECGRRLYWCRTRCWREGPEARRWLRENGAD